MARSMTALAAVVFLTHALAAQPGPSIVSATWSDGRVEARVWEPTMTVYSWFWIFHPSGFTSWDIPKTATIKRGDRRIRVDVERLRLQMRTDPAANPALQPGDQVIFDPPKYFSF